MVREDSVTSPGAGDEANLQSAAAPATVDAADPAGPGAEAADKGDSPQEEKPPPGPEALSPEPVLDPNTDLRNLRRTIAEDPNYTLATVPLLVDLTVKHIIQNFEYNASILNRLLRKHKEKVLEGISAKIPLKVTALLIDDEGYWKRCCQARWKVCDPSLHGGVWKRMYFERVVQEVVENFIPGTTDNFVLDQIVPLAANFVEKLDIKQLLPPIRDPTKAIIEDDNISETSSESGDDLEIDHFDFNILIPLLPNLVELHLTYGVRDAGMNFEWKLFNFTKRDCQGLARVVKDCRQLKLFRLHRSKVDDEKSRLLISCLLDHPSLTELNFSHNTISDRGARAIGKLLNGHSMLERLDLSDNLIRSAGGAAIAHALTKNTTLTSLNLRLNRLGDEGGQAICKALMKNRRLELINLASNDMSEPTAAILCQVLLDNDVLSKLDLSCNRLGTDGGKQLQEGMENNESIVQMDLRLTECGQEAEHAINNILNRNREILRENHGRKPAAANRPPNQNIRSVQPGSRSSDSRGSVAASGNQATKPSEMLAVNRSDSALHDENAVEKELVGITEE